MDEQLSMLGEIIGEPNIQESTLAKKHRIPKRSRPSPDGRFSPETAYEKIVKGIRKFFKETKLKHGVIGVSGGVDSALTLKLAVDALGPENVTALILPEFGLTSQENIDHAKTLCGFFKVQFFITPINRFLTDYQTLPWKPGKIALMNARARVRMTLLYSFANANDAMVLGTSNKSELLLGYGTKFGDLACDIEVIGDLLKTEVLRLANFAGLPPEIVNKTPTAELSPGQTDEEELGHTYEEMDKVLAKLDLGMDGLISHGLSATLVHDVVRRASQNEHKTKPAPVISVH